MLLRSNADVISHYPFARGAQGFPGAARAGTHNKSCRKRMLTANAYQQRWFDDSDWTPHTATRKPEQAVTFITADGLVTLSDAHGLSSVGGFAAPLPQHDFAAPRALLQPLPTVEEQGVCIGQTFLVAASNGRDLTRRVHLLGFCRSIDLLSEAVEDTVRSHGGAVFQRDTQPSGGLEEKLIMTIALPMLWGLPPAFDTLRTAIVHGGGIVHKVSKHWQLL